MASVKFTNMDSSLRIDATSSSSAESSGETNYPLPRPSSSPVKKGSSSRLITPRDNNRHYEEGIRNEKSYLPRIDSPLSVSRDQYNPPSLRVTVRHGRRFEYSEGSQVEKDMRNEQVEELYSKCYLVAKRTNRKAVFYKTLNIVTALYIIFAAAFIAGLAPEIGKEIYGRWIVVVLGISIAIVRGVASVFPFEQRAALLKESSTRALKLGRNVATLRDQPLEKIRSKMKKYEDELDELNFKIFVNNLVTGNGNQETRSVDSVSTPANDDTWSSYTEIV